MVYVDLVFGDYSDHVVVVCCDVCCCYACGDCGDLLVLGNLMVVCYRFGRMELRVF